MLQFLDILNIEGHPNCITGSRVTAIFLNGWILPMGGASSMEDLQSTELPRLVLWQLDEKNCLCVEYYVGLPTNPST